MPDRTYSRQEIARILDAAATRQAASPASDRDGLTLEELEGVAAASGIAPEHVAAAAAALGGAPVAPRRLLGMPVEVEGSRLIPGAVSDETWARMMGELRRTFGEDGKAGQVGRIREWRADGHGARRELSLEPDGDGTRVTLRQSIRDVSLAFHLASGLIGMMAVLFGVLFAAGVDPKFIIHTLVASAMALLLLGGVRVWARRQDERFEGVLARMERIARTDAGVPRTEPARTRAPRADSIPEAAAPAGRITLDAAEGPDAADETRLQTLRMHS